MKPKKHGILGKYLSDFAVKFLSITTKEKTTMGKTWHIWFHISFKRFVNSDIKGKW